MSKKFSFKDIENDGTIKKFLIKKIGLQPNTQKSYLYALLHFCNFTEKSPTEVFEIHRNDLRERKAEFDQWLNDAFDSYVAYLTDSDYAYSSIVIKVARVKGFLHAFKLKPTPEPTISKKNIVEDSKYALTVEDIRWAVKKSPLTYQTLFITQAQTGLSLADVIQLDIKDFINAVSKRRENLTLEQAIERVRTDKGLIGCFDLRRKKTSVEFYTFAGPEVLKNMALLLKSRDPKYLKPDMPLFIKDISRMSPELQENALKDLRLTNAAVEAYLHSLHDPKRKAIFPRIKVDGKERNYFRTHKLRKWYSNRVYHDAGLSLKDTKYLMGQKTRDVIENYVNPNNYNSLLKKYKKVLPFLAITEDIIIEKLKKENQRLKGQYEKDFRAKDEEIKNLKAKMDNEIKLLKEENRLTQNLVKDLIKNI